MVSGLDIDCKACAVCPKFIQPQKLVVVQGSEHSRLSPLNLNLNQRIVLTQFLHFTSRIL